MFGLFEFAINMSLVHSARAARIVAALQPGCEEWRENGEMRKKWRENEEMERD